jgi:hypothetical protein
MRNQAIFNNGSVVVRPSISNSGRELLINGFRVNGETFITAILGYAVNHCWPSDDLKWWQAAIAQHLGKELRDCEGDAPTNEAREDWEPYRIYEDTITIPRSKLEQLEKEIEELKKGSK